MAECGAALRRELLMSGRPSAAADKAARWLSAGHGSAADAARRFGLSPSQARRIAARVGVPKRPRGRPRAA